MPKRKVALLPVLIALVFIAATAARGQVADGPSYETLKAAYDYDPALPLEIQADRQPAADGVPVRVVFSSTNGERVPAVVALPSAAQFGTGPYPAIVLGHGAGGSKDDPAYRLALTTVVGGGYAAIMIDYPLHGERTQRAYFAALGSESTASAAQVSEVLDLFASAAVQTVVDQRRAIDFLCTLESVDKDRIGYLGFSLGAILGSVLCAVEPRLKSGALLVGGADWGRLLGGTSIPAIAAARNAGMLDIALVAERMQAAEPRYFAPHIGCPLLLVFGARDDVVPYNECGALLAELAPEPKTVIVYPNSGHGLLPADLMDAIGKLTAFWRSTLGR